MAFLGRKTETRLKRVVGDDNRVLPGLNDEDIKLYEANLTPNSKQMDWLHH